MSENAQEIIIQALLVVAITLAIFKVLKDKQTYLGYRKIDREKAPIRYWFSVSLLIIVNTAMVEVLIKKLA